jgi:[ribosomal protein S5]-alanine N-acetyltransferase
MSTYVYEDGLTTSRLITRFLQEDDYKIWMEFLDEPECIKFFPWFAADTTIERSKQWIARQLHRYREKQYGLQALINRHTGEFIGQCGLITQQIDGKQELEVGYHILKKYWGQGYATEAAKAFFEFGFAHKQADSIISIIDIRNTPSQKVAEKNGLKREKQVRWLDMDVFVYRMVKSVK